MRTDVCPVCGCKNSLSKESKNISVKYGNTVEQCDIINYKCSCCGAEFADDTDQSVKKAVSIARQKDVARILSEEKFNFSFTDMERSFNLPPRTISKWKNMSKSPSAAAAALVNLIGVFPWLTYVADSGYDLETAYKIAGIALLKQVVKNESVTAFYTISEEKTTIGLSKNLETEYLIAGDVYDC